MDSAINKDKEPDGRPTVPDADDFGLPIRHYPPPQPASLTAEEGNDDAVSGTRLTSDGALSPMADSAKTPDAESDCDETAFEDAQPVIENADDAVSKASEALPSSPPPPPVDPGPTTPGSERSRLDDSAITTSGADVATPNLSQRDTDSTPRAEQGTPRPTASKSSVDMPRTRRSRGDSLTGGTANGLAISEFSHQQLSMQPKAEEEDVDDGWQTMPAYARFDMYDDNDRLIAREHHEDEQAADAGYSGLGGAGNGYTRVIMDDDAQSATSLDENTKYLFKDANGTSMAGDDEGRDAIAQMQATKDILTEGQRIAYVGVVRLEIAELVKDADAVEVTKKNKREVRAASEAVKMWGQKMMIRLYGHMDISAAEQLMIEQLSAHDVRPRDLTPALHANSRVQNPMALEAGERRSSKPSPGGIGEEQEEVVEEEKVAEAPPPYEADTSLGEEVPEAQTPSQLPTTDEIDIDLRWTVLCDLFLVLIADSAYDARSRVLLERVGASLDISWIDICRFEKRITDALEMQQQAEKENWNEDEHMENRRKMALKRRYVMMGLATVGGGLVIGLSAGLLAPVIGAGLAAGFTTIGVTGTSGFLAGAGGAAVITSGAAASGSIIGVRAANRRTGAVKTFEYRPLHNKKRVNLIVTVSGWLTGKVDDVRLPFSTVDPIMGDIYSVLWEPEMLRSMGDTINILATEALTQGLQQILGSTILVSLMAALQLPIVLTKLSYLIDNPWAVSLDRATAAGLILADSLMERSLGTRPITLVGYSLGARVIFSCLQELAKRGAYGLVQNVYLFGSPVVVKKEEYLQARTVVCGRFLNGFNRNDWILGYLFRLTNGGIRRVAGLAAIEDCPWLENMDVTDIVAGHMEYRKSMPTLLMKCGWMVEREEFSEIEDPDPENHQERQRELINEIEEARKELERDGKAKKGSKFGIFGRRKQAERQEWEVYEDSAGKEGVRTEGNGPGVLFDVDAIRAELAKEKLAGTKEETLQVREIESTLPPMKLQVAPDAGPRSLRETRSAEAIPVQRPSEEAPGEAEGRLRVASFTVGRKDDEASVRPGVVASQTLPNVALTSSWTDPDDEDFGVEKEISMTFA